RHAVLGNSPLRPWLRSVAAARLIARFARHPVSQFFHECLILDHRCPLICNAKMPPSLNQALESASRSSVGLRQIFSRVRPALKFLAAATVAVFAYWNVWTVFIASIYLPPRETEEIVMLEKRLAPIRENLLAIGYRGEIALITNQVLAGLPPRP